MIKGYCKECKFFMNTFVKEELDATDYEDVVCTYHMADGFTSNDYCSMFENKNDNDAKIIYARFYEDTDKIKPNEKYIYYKPDGTEYIWKDDMWVRI